MKPIPRQTIKVSKGKLYSTSIGIAKIVAENGSALLKDVLYVPKLGVNLLSGKRVCQQGLQGSFDENTMNFSQDGKAIIQASQQDSLYIVKSIAKGYSEEAFIGSLSSSSGSPGSSLLGSGSPSLALLSQSNRPREPYILDCYWLYHRRFGHLGS